MLRKIKQEEFYRAIELDSDIIEKFNIEQGGMVRGSTYDSIAKKIHNNIVKRDVFAVIGEPGSGKTTMVFDILNNIDNLTVITLSSPDRKRITIGQVLNAVIYNLSSESPRRDLEARSEQVKRILFENVERLRKQVAIVIDEAQHLHMNTLKSLKSMRDYCFLGNKRLFSVFLLGQGKLEEKLNSDLETGGRWRYDNLIYERSDLSKIIDSYLGESIDNSIKNKLISTANSNILLLENLLERGLTEAYFKGKNRISQLDLTDFNISEQKQTTGKIESLRQKLASKTVSRVG